MIRSFSRCRVTLFIVPALLGIVTGPVRSSGAEPRAAVGSTATQEASLVPPELFSVGEGLEVTVWARSPDLRNPTNIDIDASGRIWVTEAVNYRRHQDRDPRGDRVVVLEDTDGDGVADKSTVFVQEPSLIAPLGIAVIDNRVMVSCAPDLIVYTDVNRNAVFEPGIDRREVLLTGFNGRNHDHSLHSVTAGPDGRWYFSQGNAGALFTDRSGRTFRSGAVYDPVRSGRATPYYGWIPPDFAGARSDDGHVYVGGFAARMRPDGTDVEIIGHNFRNSYEQCVTSFGDVFQNDNDDTSACRTSYLLEYANMGFFSSDGTRTWKADRRPGQNIATAGWRQQDPGVAPAGDVYGGGAPTGIVFYEGDALGPQWRGVLLSAEAGRNTILGYFPRSEGAGYALERFNFLTTNREGDFAGTDFNRETRAQEIKTLFRPSDVAVGPDGAIYVADWFDPRVGGHEDHDEGTHGAIYRIAPRGFRSVIPDINLDTVEGGIDALKSPAVNVRALGFERLKTGGPAVVEPVAALLSEENPYIRARAVWLLAQLGPQGISHVEQLLRADDPMMRAVAFRSLRRVGHRVMTHAGKLATDSSPVVRREVALAMRDVPFSEARDVLLTLARSYDGRDRSYLEAWGIGCTGKEDEVYAAIMRSHPGAGDPERWPDALAGLVWRLTPAAAVDALAVRAASTRLAEHERHAAITALGFIPTEAAAGALLDLAGNGREAVSGQPLWWLLNYGGSRWAHAGVPEALKERGIYDPEKVVPTPSVVPPMREQDVLRTEEILALAGDPGAAKVQSCYLCHRVGDHGIEYGPELTGWAGRQSREAVVRAIIDPSAAIAHGYDGVEVVTTDGTVIHGLPLGGRDPLVIQSMGGVQQMIPLALIRTEKRLRRSLMLSAGQLNMTAQDVADIAAYLEQN